MFKILLAAVSLCLALAHAANIRYNHRTRTVHHTSNQDVIKMVVMGDWGGLPVPPYYSPFEFTTAKRIMKQAEADGSDFLLALGDNFYFDGVQNEYDQRFKGTFENVFNDQSFIHTPWFVLAGNHDHYGNVTGQIEYTKHSERWNFPNLWYSIDVQTGNVSMTILMIDTVTLCGNTLHDKEGSQPSGLVNDNAVMDQLSFIEDKLKNNPNHYVLVAGHFPMWSIAEHGPTQCLIDKLKPMLEKYKVNAYFSGHDHNLQHIREKNSTVEYFVSGAVDVVDPSTKHESSIPTGSLQFHWANLLGLGGFATVSATKDGMELHFYSATGSLLYKHAIPPRK